MSVEFHPGRAVGARQRASSAVFSFPLFLCHYECDGKEFCCSSCWLFVAFAPFRSVLFWMTLAQVELFVKNDDIERTEDNFFLLSIGIIFFVCPLLSLTDSSAPLLLWRRAGRCGTSVTGAEVKDVTGPESLLLPRNISLFLYFFSF